MLFGGGADEADDTADVASAPVASGGQPQAGTTVAAASLPGVALPDTAPRPPRDVGAAAAVADGADTSAGTQLLAAIDVPIPTTRPDYRAEQSSVPAVQLAAAEPDRLRFEVPGMRSSDAVADLLKSSAMREPSATLAAYVPVPGDKPLRGAFTVASADDMPIPFGPGQRAGAAETQASIRRLVAVTAAAAATPRLALIKRGDGAAPEAVVASGVRTTPKDARLSADSTARATRELKSMVVPVGPEIARWALARDPATVFPAGGQAPSFAHHLVRTAPTVVYTAGFEPVRPIDSRRFSGNAVTFLSVARFGTD